MMDPSTVRILLLVLVSYLAGAIPFGLLIAKSRGVDIRKAGSGNIGATNVLRVLGKPLGILTFVLDALKGFIPVFFLPLWFETGMDRELLALAAGVAAILGHNFPVYLGFKGGKGVATSAGVLLGITPLSAMAGLGAWVLFFFTTRYVSLASIVAAVVVGISGWVLYFDGDSIILPSVLTVLCGLILIRHRANMVRLMNGTESRFQRKKGGSS